MTERLCIGCRMLDEAKPGEGEARTPPYVHHEIHRIPDEEQDPDE